MLAGGLYGYYLNTRARPRRPARRWSLAAILVVGGPRHRRASWTNLLTTIPHRRDRLAGRPRPTASNARRTAELRERAERLERERETEARAAVAEERTRIAREMHDVVAHSLSVMVVQAEAAEEMLVGRPRARPHARSTAVQDTGRTALTELRRMLGVLREIEEGPDLAPQPGLAGLDGARPAGARRGPAGDRAGGGRAPAAVADRRPPGVPHRAGGPHERPQARRPRPRPGGRCATSRASCVLEVSDDGRGYDPDTDGGGHGLVGMRERVAVCGGELTAGRRARGRASASVARLPVEQGAPRVIRVLIADDQALVRDGFGMILDAQADIEVVGGAADGREAIEQARELRPDVILMDIRMPEVDGIEATRRLLRRRRARPRVLMLTTFDQNEYVYEAMKAGASGFLLKDVRREELVGAVRTVAAGDAMLAPALTRRLIEDFVRRPPPGAEPTGALAELTDRESEVVRLVARGPLQRRDRRASWW